MPPRPRTRSRSPGWSGRWTSAIYCKDAQDAYLEVPTHVGNYRSDTGELLGVVGRGFHPLQNQDLAEVIDGLRKDGDIEIETAGSLRGGKSIWFLAKLASFGVGWGQADEHAVYAAFSNAHDGSRVFQVFGTSIRVVCANTERMALTQAAARDNAISLRHTKGLKNRVAEAADALFILKQSVSEWREQTNGLASRPLNQEELKTFFTEVYQREYGNFSLSPKTKQEQRSKDRALDVVGAWALNMDDPRQTETGVQGTAYAALNAVTQWADHEKTVRSRKGDKPGDARVASNIFGTSHKLKTHARKAALALLG